MTTPDPFAPGYRLTDGNQLNDRIANPQWSIIPDARATAGGLMATSTQIVSAITTIVSVPVQGAGITLPQALEGTVLLVTNNGANDVRIFAAGNSTVDGQSGLTGILLQKGSTGLFVATATQQWDLLNLNISVPIGSVTRRQLFNAMLIQGIFNQIYVAVPNDTPAWVDFNAATTILITDPLGVLISSIIGGAATITLWALAGTLES